MSIRGHGALAIAVLLGAAAPGALAMAVLLGATPPVSAESACGEHPYLADCREKLVALLTPAERARLDEIPLAGAGAPAAPLRRLEADHVLRRLAPLVADAQGRKADAARLRALAPITSRARARAAGRAVREPITPPPAPKTPSDAVVAHPLGGCDYPLVHAGLDAAEIEKTGGERQESACRAPLVACGALREGVDRAAVVDALLAMMRELAARGKALGRPRCRR